MQIANHLPTPIITPRHQATGHGGSSGSKNSGHKTCQITKNQSTFTTGKYAVKLAPWRAILIKVQIRPLGAAAGDPNIVRTQLEHLNSNQTTNKKSPQEGGLKINWQGSHILKFAPPRRQVTQMKSYIYCTKVRNHHWSRTFWCQFCRVLPGNMGNAYFI